MPFLIPYTTLKSIYDFLSPCFKNTISFVRTYIATPANHYPPPELFQSIIQFHNSWPMWLSNVMLFRTCIALKLSCFHKQIQGGLHLVDEVHVCESEKKVPKMHTISIHSWLIGLVKGTLIIPINKGGLTRVQEISEDDVKFLHTMILMPPKDVESNCSFGH